MENWEEIAGLRVIGRLGEMVNRRWNLGLGFADSSGVLANGPLIEGFATQRPLCELVKSTPDGRLRCAATAQGMAAQYHRDQKTGACEYICHAGLREIYVPVLVEGQLSGFILAGGFLSREDLERRRPEIVRRGVELGLAAGEIEATLRRMPLLSAEGVEILKDVLELVVREILIYHQEIGRRERRLDRLAKELAEKSAYGQLVGRCEPMLRLYRLLDKIAATDSTVLIEGENGTGKELAARAIHQNSARCQKPFLVQNCSAFNDNLLDSELFGHEKGAFTGASTSKKGLFEVADGGTFFLDEIGDMSPALQVKLLRVLQEGTFLPLGSTEERRVDVRIIAATNRDLKALVEKGQFRQDLYFRINVITVTMPPLRERKEDIPLLVDHFLAKHRQRGSRPRLSPQAMERLLDYNWPGNVRELENEIERLLVLCGEDEVIQEEFLSPRIRYVNLNPQLPQASELNLPQAIERLEKDMILDHLKRARWNKSRAAETLGISRRNLIRKVQLYQLDRRRHRAPR